MVRSTQLAVGLAVYLACAAPASAALDVMRPQPSNSSRLILFPDTGAEAEAELGQSMISAAVITSRPMLRVKQSINHQVSKNSAATIPAGMLGLAAVNDEGSFYGGSKILKLTTEFGFLPKRHSETFWDGGVFVPKDGGKPLLYATTNGQKAIFQENAVIDCEEITQTDVTGPNLNRELLYSGLSQSTVSIVYREFINDMARPAFTQELKYDLSQGTEVGFRGARFRILSANNTSIRFVVLKPLDSPTR